jgi:peroxiredoxin
MQALSTKYAARGLVVLGVAVDDNPGLVLQRLRELGITYPNVIDAEGSLRGALRVKELPTTLVIDRAGIVRLVRAGGDAGDMEAIEQAAEALLEETKQ